MASINISKADAIGLIEGTDFIDHQIRSVRSHGALYEIVFRRATDRLYRLRFERLHGENKVREDGGLELNPDGTVTCSEVFAALAVVYRLKSD